MAVAEPDDVNEIFRRMTEDLDVSPDTIPLVVVSSLSDIELIEKFNSARRELHAREELIVAHTDTGRDLHSVYHACLLEMKKRGLS